MKKGLGYILFGLCLSFILINNIYAEDVNFELKLSNASNEIISGNYIDVKLTMNGFENNNLIDYCDLTIESSFDFEFKEIQVLNSWTISNNYVNANLIDLKFKNNQSSLNGNVNIANIKYVVPTNGYVKINNVSCYDTSGGMVPSNINQEVLVVNVIEDTSAKLKSLKINNEELNPRFSSNITSYNINNFNSNSLSLEYEVNDPMFQDQVVVTVNDKIVSDLNNISYEVVEGNKSMLITINVANSKTYNVFVTKELNTEVNNTISMVTINGESLEMVPGKFDYVYTVSDDITSVEISAVLSDEENFQFGKSSNVPATFEMTGKIVAIMDVISKNNPSDIPTETYTLTIVNESNASGLSKPDIGDNPDTSDTSMYIMGMLLLISLFATITLYQKNLNAYK